MRLTTVADEEALVFHAALSLPPAPELAARVRRAAAGLEAKNPRAAVEGGLAPTPHTFWTTAERLRRAVGVQSIKEAMPDRAVVSLDQQREALRIYKSKVRKVLG